MKTPKHILLMLTISGMCFMLQTCKRGEGCEEDKEITEYKIDEGQLKKIPYKGFESLTFVRTTTGDTHTFVGNGWKTYWGLYDAGFECPILERYEKRQLIFRSTTFPKPIGISIYIENNNKWTILAVEFQNQIFQEGSASVKNPYDLDTLAVLGTEYYGITYIADVSNFVPVTYKCYYNEQTGIIRLFFENGETWDLLKQ